MEKLEASYAHLSPTDCQLFSALRGQLVAAKYSADEAWYRGRVEKLIDDNTMEVRFIDYGNKECLFSSELKQLTEEFLPVPGYALQCCLDGVSLLKIVTS